MSSHEVRVVRLGEIRRHPNADSLGITEIMGYTVVVRLSDWKEGDLGAYIEPDYVVPDTPEFAFMNGSRRVKVKRLRGVYSQGLLIPAPDGAAEGDDVMGLLGITRHEPALKLQNTENICGPGVPTPVYDVESWNKWKNLLIRGESIVVTEKIHGANGRYLWHGERMWCGSRSCWKKDGSPWHRALELCPWIEEWCRAHPDTVLYGELFGNVQDLKYDRVLDFLAFDHSVGGVLRGRPNDLDASRMAPILFSGPYEPTTVADLAEGQSTLAGHVREGCVIEAFEHVRGPRTIGRVKLKIVGNGYLERA